LLRKIKDLVEAGATVIGAPPRQSPSLSRYPECDQEVKQLAAELWGDASGSKITERAYGKGRVVWTTAPEKYLDQSGVSADFTGPGALRFIHRRTEDTDIYFVANTSPRDLNTTGVFRIQGKVPELWWPDSGRIERAPLYREEKGLTTVSLRLEPSGSVFVIFQKSDPGSDPVVTVTRDGQSVLSAIPAPPAKIQIQSARYGDPSDPRRVRDVRDLVQDKVDQGETDFVVLSLAEGNDPAPGVLKTLAVDYTIEGRPYSVQAVDPDTIHISEDAVSITVEKARYGVLDDPQRTRDVRGKLQRLADAGESRFPVARMAEGDDPAFLVVKMLELEYTRDGQRVAVRAQDPDLIDLKPVSTEKTERIAEAGCDSTGQFYLDALQTGRYELTTATGKQRAITVDHLPESQDIPGPWEVHFAPGWGAPGNARFDSLISWTNHPDPGIQCFSGAAVYTRT
ncbi:MAG TPA: glycosyl hydrolase, partial [bacterium]|nr:glycosyl hydrolase [bacterium]